MAKIEKIKFEDLEKLGGSKKQLLSQDELASIVSDPESLKKQLEENGVRLLTSLLFRLKESSDFRDKILELLKHKEK